MKKKVIGWVLVVSMMFVLMGCTGKSEQAVTKTGETEKVEEESKKQEDKDKGEKSGDAEPYYVAYAAPLTGDYANQGEEGYSALMMAIDEFNAAGGYDGHTIVVDRFDDKNDPTEAANIAQQIVSEKKYIAAVGSFASGATMAGAPIYDGNMVQFSPSASSMAIPDSGSWTWMFCPDAGTQYKSWARIACEVLGAKTIGMIVIDGDNGEMILNTVTDAAPQYGGKVIANDKFISGQTRDFTSLLQKVNKDNPDVIGIFCSYADSSAMIMQARDLGIETKLFLSPDSYNQYLLDALGDTDTTDVYVASMITPDAKDENVKQFTKKFNEENGYYPGVIGSGAYECGNMIIRVIEDGATDRQSFHDILAGYKSTAGKVYDDQIDENRKVQRDAFFISEIVDGTYKCMN